MKVRVIAFATASDILGSEILELTLPEGSGVERLRQELVDTHPLLEAMWDRLAVAVDGDLVRGERRLRDGCEVALLPPVSGGAPRAYLVDGPIDVAAVERSVADPACGAVLLFLGNVRDHHAGRRVEKIDYSGYRSMAEAVLERIVADLEAGDESLRVAIVHRLGEVPVGEASVVIAASSPHRAAAYEASRLALERLKREAPIWKREHYVGGEATWREEESLVATGSRVSA
ncbi:MAG: molybdopterin converting factor [bacterium]|nr:molybdopterin converting factor [bacterium]